MRWRKRGLWKTGIVVADVLLLLVLMTWVPLSAARADEGVSEAAMEGPVTVQAAPTEDATVTALSKEKLAQEVQQLKNQNEPDPLGWLQTNASFLFSTLVVVGGGLFGLWRWRVDRRDAQDKELKDRRNAQDKELKDRQNAQDKELEDRKTEREKRAEERFQAAVTGLGDEKEEAHIGAAILLRTFLRPGYEQFYTQTFDLAVANLRHHRTFKRMQPQLLDASQNTETPLPLTTLDHALIVVFKEAFPLARDQEKREPAFFNVTGISLDYAYLAAADLKELWGPKASLQEAELNEANLSEAVRREVASIIVP